MHFSMTFGSKLQLRMFLRKAFEKDHVMQEDGFNCAAVRREESHELIFLEDQVPQAEISEAGPGQRSKAASQAPDFRRKPHRTLGPPFCVSVCKSIVARCRKAMQVRISSVLVIPGIMYEILSFAATTVND